MEKDNRELLDDVIRKTLEDLGSMETGTEEWEKLSEELRKLYQLKLDDDRTNWEYSDRSEKRAEEETSKKKDRQIRIGLGLLELLIPIISYRSLFLRGLKFEETGSIASSMMRNLLSKAKFGRR